MNDEDFARNLLTRALPGSTAEPTMALDVDQLVHRQRRTTRARRLGLATGGTVLAGLVAVLAWGGLGLGSSGQPTTVVGPAAGGPASEASANDPIKQSAPAPALATKGVTCTTSTDLAAIAAAALPADLVVSSSSSGCLDVGGARVRTARLDLASSAGTILVEVDSLDATPDPSGSPAVRIPGASGWADQAGAECSSSGAAGTVCVASVTKGDTKTTLLLLKVPGDPELVVQLSDIGSSSGGAVPLSDAQATTLARAVIQQL